jgi:predicted phage tail protein
MISREAVEVLGFAAVVAGFYEALGLAAALFAAGLSAIFLASFGGRR